MRFQQTFLAVACCVLNATVSFGSWDTNVRRKRFRGGPKAEVMDRLDQPLNIGGNEFINVSDIYYTHGDGSPERAATVSLSFQDGETVHGELPTIYDSVMALLVGDHNVHQGIIQRLDANGVTMRTVTSKQLSQALYDTQVDFRRYGWDLIPDVIIYKNGRVNRFYSNNNRSLYCLQTIQKFFRKTLTVAYNKIQRKSLQHEWSNINDCQEMKIRGADKYLRNPNKRNILNIFPGGFLNVEGLNDHVEECDTVGDFFKKPRGFGNFVGSGGFSSGGFTPSKRRSASTKSKDAWSSSGGFTRSKRRSTKKDRSAWRRRLLIQVVC